MIDQPAESQSGSQHDPIPRPLHRSADPPPPTGVVPSQDSSRSDEAERTLLAIVGHVTAHGVVIAGCALPVRAETSTAGRTVPLLLERDIRGREAALLARLLRELRGQEDYLAGRNDEQRELEAQLVAEAVAAALGWPVKRTGAFPWAGTMEELGASLGAARRLIEAAVPHGITSPPPRKSPAAS